MAIAIPTIVDTQIATLQAALLPHNTAATATSSSPLPPYVQANRIADLIRILTDLIDASGLTATGGSTTTVQDTGAYTTVNSLRGCTVTFVGNVTAALAGATFISPFVGRLDDIGENGMKLVKDIVDVYNKYSETIKTQVLAASIRHPQHCVEAALAGAHIATVPYQVLVQMIKHPLSDIGITRFMEDWQKVMGKD